MKTPQTPTNSKAVVSLAKDQALFYNLKQQLVKDFSLAALDLDIEDDSPETLINAVEASLIGNIQNKPQAIQNLLYVIDIPEVVIATLPSEDDVAFVKAITFLILKRCWMKVWYKATY